MTAAALRADARACFDAALAAVEPGALVRRRLRRVGVELVLSAPDGIVVGRHGGPAVVVGAGKAALAMGGAAAAVAGPACRGGLVIVPSGGDAPPAPGPLAVATGRHPVPDAAGARATADLLRRVRAADAATLVLAVVSGGASSLLVAPAPGIPLAAKQAVTAALLAAGATIDELNTVRRHCSLVKGGGLARAAAGAAGLWVLLLSDVIGDDPAVIASGPAAADATTYADARAVLARRLRPEDVPAAIAAHLARGAAGDVPETVKPGDPVLARVRSVTVGTNRTAVDAAAAAAAARGYTVDVVPEPLAGEAGAAGRMLARRLLALAPGRPAAVVAGGETTVRAAGGRGGRAQHLALAAALELAGSPGVLLAAGTDGVDGPTDAAGACVDGDTVARAAAHGRDAAAGLAATDSTTVLEAAGDLVRTGPTGTNVADVVVALRPAW